MEQALEFYDRGVEQAKRGETQAAIREFDRALRLNPELADAYYRRGLARFDLGQFQAAIADYTQTLHLQPERADVYLGRALVQLALGELQGALADVNQAIQLQPATAAAYQLKATVQRRLGERTAAISSLKQAAKLYLDQKDAVRGRRCLDLISEIETSLPQPVPALRPLMPPEDFFAQVIQQVEQQEYRRALDNLNWLIQVDAQDARAYSYRGLVRGKLGNLQGAVADLNQSIQLQPQDLQTYCHRGLVRIELGDFDGAIADLNQVLQQNSSFTAAYVSRGHAHCKLGNYRQGIEDYSHALYLQPHQPQLYQHRAEARFKFEDWQGAIDDYQQAANFYFTRNDWDNYRRILEQIKQVRSTQSQNEDSVVEIYDDELEAVSLELQNQLLSLVGGHADIAERLLDLARENYPDRPEEWYWEKVIADLKHDR